MRILLVEDEPDLGRVVRRALEEEGHACDWSQDGEDARHRALTGPYDAVVLDLMLPGVDGWTILRAMRERGRDVPVLVLTARDAVRDRVRGLDQGADDYLTKPFALGELLARVRALIRRSAAKPSPLLEVGDARIDTASGGRADGEGVRPAPGSGWIRAAVRIRGGARRHDQGRERPGGRGVFHIRLPVAT